MALTPEWRHRIDAWRKALWRLVYRPLGAVPLRAFYTHEQLTAAQARKRAFADAPPGTRWGEKWQYGWFLARIALGPEAAGERIVLRPKLGGDSVLFIGDRAVGAVDREHPEVTLSRRAKKGERFEILAEAYAWHGHVELGRGPILHGEQSMPEPGPTQQTVGESTYGIWDEQMFQAWLDLETLVQVRDGIDAESLRVAEIDEALCDFTVIVDPELPRKELLFGVAKGRERLAPLLACKNGSTSPLMLCFGHAHIDVAWLWPLAETERKAARTFSTVLAQMEQYPEYRFLQSQPHLYRMVKERYPELYERIKKAVKAGQWIAEGGMWVEADTNLTGGESLIRQFVHGMRFMEQELGARCELLWLPDVFGYSGALPQIMEGCGIRYFSTQKIFWTYNGGDVFPYNTFFWQGIDGTRVLSHFHNDYNALTDPSQIIQRWNERVQKNGIRARLYPFGHGDGGGGPTRKHLEFLRRTADLEGVPRTRQGHPNELFRDVEKDASKLPVYVGELYFQNHRGTYTSQARTKRGNRKSELALREAEMWGAAAACLAGAAYPAAEMDELWKIVLLNQFHDIIPGSSIARVYEEAEAGHAKVLAVSKKNAEAAARRFVKRDAAALTVYNSLSWPRSALVALPRGFEGAEDVQGHPLPVQKVGSTAYVHVRDIPSCGFTTVRRHRPGRAVVRATAGTRLLENEHLRARFDDRGRITSLYDKDARREIAVGPLNELCMYKDVPGAWDAWDIDSTYKSCPVELAEPAQIDILARGPLWASLRIRRKLHESRLEQEVRLVAGARRLDFITKIDWRESHKLLKVAFPVDVRADEALHEIQFGHIRRPTHRSRPYDADRFEVPCHKWTALVEEARGAAVLNDSKYGVDVSGSSINLTLLRAAVGPDPAADRGKQTFTYSLLVYEGPFATSPVVREAYELNVEPLALRGSAGSATLFSVEPSNVVIEAVKPAEDGSGDVVVRLYEALRTATRCTVTTTLPVRQASETNMLELQPRRLLHKDGRIELVFRPFEIKTLRLRV